MAKPFKKIFDKETLHDLLIAVIDRADFLPSKMGELRRTVITSAKPDVAGHTVSIKGESFGTGAVYNKKKLVPNAIYPLNIKFYNVSFNDKKNLQHTVKVNLGHGDFIWQEPLRKGRHPVEVKCTCFVGGTLVQMADGNSVKIKDLVGKKQFYVYSYNLETRQNVIGLGHSARLTGIDEKVVKVTFDNGHSVVCTPDHEFLMSNREYKEVKNIEIGSEFKTIFSDNLKVTNIEDAGYQDVYCLTVNKYHNFTIGASGEEQYSSGIYVSNCKDHYFRFWKWDDLAKSHFGRKFPKYVRKTTTWPEVNPCFVGSTKIKLLDGTTRSIKWLAENYYDKEFWVYSYDGDKIVPGKAHSPRVTANVDELVEITLDNGKKEFCTVDHLWMTRDGMYKRANQLSVGDSIMPLHTRKFFPHNNTKEYYQQIHDPSGKWEFTHKRVLLEVHNSKTSRENHAHHIDGNKQNNTPSNLVVMDRKKHNAMHTRERMANDHEYKEKMRLVSKNIMLKNWQNPEFVKKIKEAASKHLKGKWANDKKFIQTMFEKSSKQMTKLNNEWWQDEQYREKMSKMMSKRIGEYWLNNGDKLREERATQEHKNNYQKVRIIKLAKKLTNDGFEINESNWDSTVKQYIQKHKLDNRAGRYLTAINKYFSGGFSELLSEVTVHNHNIIDIRTIKLNKFIPVYDFEVEKHHNFALASGVFVHNSKVEGFCKHLYSLVLKLEKEGLLKK